jgi:hypothetical protein
MFFTSVLYAGETTVYLVRPKDSLSKIAALQFDGPIYDRQHGSLKQLLELNPWIKNPDRIYPGQKLTVNKINLSKLESGDRNPAEEIPKNTGTCMATPEPGPDQSHAPSPSAEPPATSTLKLGVGYEYLRIDSIDLYRNLNSTFLSRLSPRYEFQWLLNWSDEWSPFLGFSTTTATIDPDINSDSNILNKTTTRNQIRLGTEYHPATNLQFDFAFTNLTRIVPRATSLTEITLDQINTNNLSIGVEYIYLRKRKVDLSAGFLGGISLGGNTGSYSIKPGYDGRIELGLKHVTHSAELQGHVFVQYSKLNSSFAEQTDQTVGANISLSKCLGE